MASHLGSLDSFDSDTLQNTGRFRGTSSVVAVNVTSATKETATVRPLRRAKSLPSMTNHEAEVLYNRMHGIKSILKCGLHVNAPGTLSCCSAIATTRSAKESMNRATKNNNSNKYKQQQRSSSKKIKNGTIIECKNDDNVNIESDIILTDDDLDDDTTNLNSTIEFHNVEIREYARTVGDNPSCSSGAPIT
jgi:hypothetical protein